MEQGSHIWILSPLRVFRDFAPLNRNSLKNDLIIGVGLLCFLISCSSNEAGTDDLGGPVRVVTTTTVVTDLVESIGGEAVSVEGLMGPGVDPHLFKASAGDVVLMAEADIIIYNGLHLEGKMGDVFEQMRSLQINTVAVAEGIPDSLLIESELFQGNYDPHIWLDASLWKQAAADVVEALVTVDPAHADTFHSRYARFAASLDEMDQYVRQEVSVIPSAQRVVITSHDAFGYFGKAYGFEVLGLQGITTAAEAGTADVRRIASVVTERRIPAMFIESSVSSRGIEAVREAVRARGFEVIIGGTLYGDALGEPASATGSYLGMLRHNTDTIVEALTNYGGS